MHLVLYCITFVGAWLGGWLLGTGAPSWGFWLAAAGFAGGLWGLRTAPWLPSSEPAPGEALSIAHRAWLTSSAACFMVFVGVGITVGWSFPALSYQGLELDPVGALGWTPDRLRVQLSVVYFILLLGVLMFALGLWRWFGAHRASRPAIVVLPWALGASCWLVCLGLLIGLSQPWRNALDTPVAREWSADMPTHEIPRMAQRALAQGREDPVSAIWAHALGLRAFQQGHWDRSQLDAFLTQLAQANFHRNKKTSPWWPFTEEVGVDKRRLCRAQATRPPAKPAQWVALEAPCRQGMGGEVWAWRANGKH